LHSVQCVYAFCVTLAINSDYFPIVPRAAGLYNGKSQSLCEYLSKGRLILVFKVLRTAVTVVVTTLNCLATVLMPKLDAVSEGTTLALTRYDFHISFIRAAKLAKKFRDFSQTCKIILVMVPHVTNCRSYFVFPRSVFSSHPTM
jgi:hypothetical protein